MPKTITLKHVGFRCVGDCEVNSWDGGHGSIGMTPWDTKTSDKAEVVKGVNDAQYGCESIESAIVLVFDLYENGYVDSESVATYAFAKVELRKAKRGI